jgi:hypothetical protein
VFTCFDWNIPSLLLDRLDLHGATDALDQLRQQTVAINGDLLDLALGNGPFQFLDSCCNVRFSQQTVAALQRPPLTLSA